VDWEATIMETLHDSEETKRLISGCRTVDISKLSDNDPCPFQAYFRSGEPCCARWGSGTPLFPFLKECTVKDLKECPLTEYPDEANLVFWTYWLWKNGKIEPK
jgi:hypothetical protein